MKNILEVNCFIYPSRIIRSKNFRIEPNVPRVAKKRQVPKTKMISIERARELIGDKDMSDEEVDRVRCDCRELAEIIIEKYLEDKKKARIGYSE